MYALTLWQPWASLVIGNFKPWEFRPRPAARGAMGKRLVIHAGARKPRRREIAELLAGVKGEIRAGRLKGDVVEFLRLVEAEPDRLPLGAGLGTVHLASCRRADEIWPEEFAGASDRLDRANYALEMADVQPWTPIVPSIGNRRFWHWKGALP